jgi:hypothetical protein
MIAVNVAKPGGLVVIEPFVVVDDYVKHHNSHITSFDVTREFATGRGWPKLQELSVAKAWEWLQTVPGFLQFESQTPCGRALAAFTYLLIEHSEESPLDVLWLLMALEALYSHGHEALKFQLRAKAEALLGKPEKFKKMLSLTYDFRSALVHGDVNLPFRHAPGDWVSESYDKMDEAKQSAMAVLLATFQEMILRNKHELNFDYELTDK